MKIEKSLSSTAGFLDPQNSKNFDGTKTTKEFLLAQNATQNNKHLDMLSESNNLLLKRKEIRFVVEEKSNPGFEKVKNILVEKLKVSPEVIAIKKIKNNFGTREFVVDAFVYSSEKDKLKIEPKVKEKKKAAS